MVSQLTWTHTLWHGDVVWGPRYLLVITPFLIIPIVELFESDIWVKKNFLKTGLTSIIAVSFIIQLAAISVDSKKYFFDLIHKDNVPFVKGQVNDTVPIFALSNETYFDWHRSPILAQFRYVYEFAIGMKHYRYSKPSANVTFIEKLRDSPIFNVFDFWWLYNYYGTGSYSGFIGALLLHSIDARTANSMSVSGELRVMNIRSRGTP